MSVSSQRWLTRLLLDERGSIALIAGAALPLLMLAAGISIDMARWIEARRTTSAALDAAVLAGARSLQMQPDDTTAAVLLARNVYRANIATRLALLTDTIDFRLSDDNNSLAATGNATLGTTFLSVAGIHTLDVVNGNQAEMPKATISIGGQGGSNVEISLMLDVTGSMCDDGVGPCRSGTKITGLKNAARDLIDIAVQRDQSRFTSRVALVPFSTRVRVAGNNGGGAIMQTLTGLPPTWSGHVRECTQDSGNGGSEGGGNWSCQAYQVRQRNNLKIMPCVTDRFYDATWRFDATDDAPGSGAWLNAHGGNRRPVALDSSDTVPASGRGLTAADPADQWNYISGNSECADVSEDNVIMPLSSDRSSLKSRVDALEAYGSTAGALGTAWSWYLLSPKWNGIFSGASAGSYGDVTARQANGAPVLRKVAVLMTDGGFNTFRGWKDQSQREVSDYALQVCAGMKAQGIEVYTVGFALDQLTSAERAIAVSTLRACGTDVRHFYETLTVPQLQAAFREIALQLSSLYLSK